MSPKDTFGQVDSSVNSMPSVSPNYSRKQQLDLFFVVSFCLPLKLALKNFNYAYNLIPGMKRGGRQFRSKLNKLFIAYHQDNVLYGTTPIISSFRSSTNNIFAVMFFFNNFITFFLCIIG